MGERKLAPLSLNRTVGRLKTEKTEVTKALAMVVAVPSGIATVPAYFVR